MTKKNVLFLGLIVSGAFLVAANPVDLGICEKSQYDCRNTFDSMQMVLGIAPLVFLFSLITYKMREEVFRAWWGFARWFAPVIVVVTFLLNLSPDGGGLGIGGAVAGAFEFFLLFLLYAAFILVSIVKIVLAHIRLKRGS